MRIERVLVPVDFSPASRLAVSHGIKFARKLQARLTLLHVVELSAALTYSFSSESSGIEKENYERARRMLPALVAPEDHDDLDLRTVVKSGNVQNEVLTTAREQHADIVVMGTHGRGLVGRLLIGSVTLSMLRKSEVPVLTVSHATRPLTFERILFATDLSEPSQSESHFVVDFARMTNSKLTFLHAVEKGRLEDGGTAMGHYVSRQHLDPSVKSEGIETVLAEGVPAEAILQTAKEASADMIVITAKHKGVLERTLLGSTAERVVREARIPVLSIPASTKMDCEWLGEIPAA